MGQLIRDMQAAISSFLTVVLAACGNHGPGPARYFDACKPGAGDPFEHRR